jgi:putative copper export protein
MTDGSLSLLLRAAPDWLELVALAGCFGALVCSLWVLGPARADVRSNPESLGAALRRLLNAGVAVLFASSIVGLFVRSAEMSGGTITGVLPVLPTILLGTHLGRAWILRIAAIIALALAIMASRRSRHPRLLEAVMLGCAVVVSAMDTASGHAADAGDFSLSEVVDWLHLLAALVWGGGLLVLSLVVLPRLVKQGDRAARELAGVSARFSRIAGVAVGLIAVTAPYQAWARAGSAEDLVSSPFGRTIIAKIVLFAVLLLLGAFNRYVSVPRLQEWAGSTTVRGGVPGRLAAPVLTLLARDADGPLAAARFKRTVRLEAILMTTVLLCAALLRHEAPSRRGAHLEHHALARSTGADERRWATTSFSPSPSGVVYRRPRRRDVRTAARPLAGLAEGDGAFVARQEREALRGRVT